MFISSEFCTIKDNNISIPSFDNAAPMANSMGVGLSLVAHNDFGADLIHFKAGEGVQNHTHPGDHILFCLKGDGFVIYQGITHSIKPGFCYFVKGESDHAIKAKTDLTLIACGNMHFPVDSPSRMEPVKYRENTPDDMKIGD